MILIDSIQRILKTNTKPSWRCISTSWWAIINPSRLHIPHFIVDIANSNPLNCIDKQFQDLKHSIKMTHLISCLKLKIRRKPWKSNVIFIFCFMPFRLLTRLTKTNYLWANNIDSMVTDASLMSSYLSF